MIPSTPLLEKVAARLRAGDEALVEAAPVWQPREKGERSDAAEEGRKSQAFKAATLSPHHDNPSCELSRACEVTHTTG